MRSNRVLIFLAFLFESVGSIDWGVTYWGGKKRDSLSISYLFNVVFLQCLRSAIDGILLHLFAHIGVLDHCLSITHCCGLDCLEECGRIEEKKNQSGTQVYLCFVKKRLLANVC